MKAVQQTIRILVLILIVENGRCQDGFSDRDILRYQQMASNEGQIEAITSYSTNIIQRDPSSQSISSVSVQYHMTDDADKNDDYNRADRTRSRKVYRIKNPFQQQLGDTDRQHESSGDPQDSNAGASNQYAAVQYSLPPEEFLHQMRAESQYYQQQPQVSTPAPNIGYTATPQPQYQYSTISASYDNSNQRNNQVSQLDAKAAQNQYFQNSNSYQFNAPNTFSLDSVQSTPSPVASYISTSLPNSQFVGTPTNPYVSSSSPIFLSSPPNLQQYVSSPLAAIQTGSPDYSNNRITTTIGSNSMNYDNIDLGKKMQIDHYDNSANGIRYPNNVPQQYQNEYTSSTPTPTSSPYTDAMRESWQNSMNAGVNALSKSLQEVSLTQYQQYPYNNQHDSRTDSDSDNSSGNSDTHRIGNLPSANNVYLNYVQPDYQTLNNIKSRTRDLEHETGQPEFFSNGDYGWKLTGKKPLINNDVYSSENYQRYQQFGSQIHGNIRDDGAVSQMNFHMDTSKPYNYDQVTKSSSENVEAQEFAKAAAKAHENLKQQQNFYENNYASYINGNNPTNQHGNTNYGNYDKQKNKYTDTSNSNLLVYSHSHPDLITAAPYYYASTRENIIDNKAKPTFDHAKALKNIVPIDVSNVVSNSDSQLKATAGLEGNNRFSIQNYGKDQADQSRQYYRPLTDSYYKDKNTMYGLNIKTKPEDYSSDTLKQFDPNISYYGKQQQSQELPYNQGGFSGTSQQSYKPQIAGNYQDSIQSSANVQQQGVQLPLNQMSPDFTSILKLNDVPYRLPQGLSSDSLRFHNNNYDQSSVSSPLPMRINQNVGSHQIDVTSNFLNKLISNNQPGISVNRPEIDSQTGGLMSTINGFKVANPYNVDLKLFAEMLKGKSPVDDTHMSFRDQFNKPAPLKLDLSQLQLLLKNENSGNLAPLNNGFSALSSPYLEIYNNGRLPYQGVKYSRSQEEEETIIPIADSSNNHPIGAVMEQDDPANEREVSTGSDITAQAEDSISSSFSEERPKKAFVISNHRTIGDRHKHPNSLLSGRYSYQRQYPKSDIEEPYPLLKPPPPHALRGRGSHFKIDRHGRRRRINKPKVFRIMKTEPLFEADSEGENLETVPIFLRPPPPNAEAKSDIIDNEPSS